MCIHTHTHTERYRVPISLRSKQPPRPFLTRRCILFYVGPDALPVLVEIYRFTTQEGSLLLEKMNSSGERVSQGDGVFPVCRINIKLVNPWLPPHNKAQHFGNKGNRRASDFTARIRSKTCLWLTHTTHIVRLLGFSC